MIKYSVWCCVLFLLTGFPVQAAYRVQQTDEPVVIVIDPGHGGENLGTIESEHDEKDMNLITAKAMYGELCLYDNVEVYMTRTEDVDLTLKARAEYAASVNADFLFSIHYNASENHNRFGTEVWISAQAPYNAYGYQFGVMQLETMQDMGLYLRGVKTRLNDEGTDYYGVIRECVALSVPAVIIEHCHVDEESDYAFCDTEEEQIAFGRANATSVAKYFGLKSSTLGVDYSNQDNLPEVAENIIEKSTLTDYSAPEVCIIEVTETNEDTGTITLGVTAADYDSPLIYYDYSYDGGLTYSPLQKWPGSDVLNGTYTDTFLVDIQVPSGTQPDLVIRAYNMFDVAAVSNRITMLRTILYQEDTTEKLFSSEQDAVASNEDEKKLPGTETFMPAISEEVDAEEGVSFFDFLLICLILVVGLFVLLFITRIIISVRRRRRRRQRRKLEGDSRNHPR